MKKKRIGVCVFEKCGSFVYGWPHHRKLQSQGGSDNDANLVDVCFEHHNWLHANPKKASELGLIILDNEPEPTEKILKVSLFKKRVPIKPTNALIEAQVERLLL